MKPNVFILYGNDFRHKREVVRLKRYLESIGCSVETCSTKSDVPERLSSSVATLSADQTFLFVYNGHGSRVGWENGVKYANIVPILANIKQLMVVNEACFATRMIAHLKQVRNTSNTGFLAPTDSRGLSYGGVIRDILTFWPLGMKKEDVTSSRFVLKRRKIKQSSTQHRWGLTLDHLFFAKEPTKLKITIGKPIMLGSAT